MEVKPAYKQTEVGVIPKDWDAIRLGESVDLRSGHHVLARFCNTSGEGTPYITGPADFPNGRIQHTKYTIKPGTLCEPNDILVTVKGSGAGTIVIADSQYCISRQLMAVSVREWDRRFVFLVLQHHSSVFGAAATGLIPGLSRSDILGALIPLPPTKAEQEAIAGALSDADALIESLEQLVAKKRQIKHGAMQQLLTGQKRLPGFTGKWETKRLGELGTFLKGSGVSKSQAMSGHLPCVRYGELYTRHNDYIKDFYSFISPEVASAATPLKRGDILFAGSGETKAEIGKCAAFVHETVAYAGGDIVILRTERQDPLFLGYFLNTPDIARQKASRGQGDAVVHISGTALAAIKAKFPKHDEQTAIAAILSDMDAEIAGLESKLAKARQVKQGMMQELLTGRIRLV